MTRLVTPQNVIRCLAELRFGSHSAQALRRLQTDLKRFRKRSGQLLSDTAIDKWFKSGARGPQRMGSIDFLSHYASSNISIRDLKSAQDRDLLWSVQDFLRLPNTTAADETGLHDAELDDGAQLSGPEGAAGRWTDQDPEAFLQFGSLEGAYQLIRPHSSIHEVFILEALSIETNEETSSASLRMYSHNQRAPEFAYLGEFYASYRYGFSLARRRHENNPARFAIRCLTFNVGTQREVEGYLRYPCLGGLMLRGVAGNTGPRRAVGLPLILIRTAEAPGHFGQATFDRVSDDLRRLYDGSAILVGEVRAESPLFQFCKKTFERLYPVESAGWVLSTPRPEDVADVISSMGTGGRQSPSDVWNATVALAVDPN
jgi:hypothetical protein